ncbi:acyltransferase [Roseovarius sp. SCSIO 43702]|uniref:acyltransferase family protein n=1 Tax=Roseovarius sp. SCSIO 43702 TaxID=2823043 RepID=UPI001C72EC02|nr:acyltransferase [Roseovarius sp. SCSIO 43702]QYX57534.1 acyltransferase [Roseovarius sp. SCSIO 43702]
MTTTNEVPRGMMASAVWAAENTPAKRNRAVDFYRAVAISFVILGHWFLVAPVIRDGEIAFPILLAEQPWTQYLTWLFQVMPVFFFVGGFANALSWTSARRDRRTARAWISGRLARLLKPTVPLVIVWSIAAAVATQLGVAPDLIALTSQAALVPIWFLAVYIVITLVVPLSYAVHERLSFGSVIILALGAILVDAVAFGLDQEWLRWVNYGFVWLAVHQLGYWWNDAARPGLVALGLVALGLAWLYVLIGILDFPVAMVSVPGDEFSNTRPPTTAMLGLGCVQVGIILLLAGPVSRWLRRTRPWAVVILLNQMIMTVYLWHMTAMILVVGIAVLLGGLGLGVDPGTAEWWTLRPLWLLIFGAALLPLVLVFVRFESGSRGGVEGAPGPAQAVLGACVTCAGLVMMALSGIGADMALGVNWIALVAVLVGVFLATRRIA